jgi:dTDP-glucose 4,6-dehydratase
MILVTGGAGFIGSNFIQTWIELKGEHLLNLDKLTYAGNMANLAPVRDNPRHQFVRGDIGDRDLVGGLLRKYQPRAIVNFAAESHVDRSIHGPADFIDTNVRGTFQLLQTVREYWSTLDLTAQERFRFLHVSTDEVYGSLAPDEEPFTEDHPYRPNSPYSASKAASDHLVRAWRHTYGLPVVTTNCSNNYGPYQFPEKLIPLMILNALRGEPLPVYGDGLQVRDWLYVEDHCRGIMRVLEAGRVGEVYNIGGNSEKPNLEVVHEICARLDELKPRADGRSYREQIAFVKDRPGHDRRYAINTRRIERELGWKPRESFESGLRKTIQWYLDNQEWVEGVTTKAYRQWVDLHYGPAQGRPLP